MVFKDYGLTYKFQRKKILLASSAPTQAYFTKQIKKFEGKFEK